MCEDCQVGMWEEEQICPSCRRPSRYGLRHEYCKRKEYLDGLTCFWAYEGIARKLISEVKYRFYYDYLKEFVVGSSWFIERPEFAYFLKFVAENPTVVPVPLHADRQKWRGFNQAEIIGQLVAGSWQLETAKILERVKDTGQQVGREKGERMEAMEGAFKINTKLPYYAKASQGSQISKILLVDDVWTTGATMQAAAKTLKEAGIKSVWGVVLAR